MTCVMCLHQYTTREYFHIWTEKVSGVRYICALGPVPGPTVTPDIPLQLPGTPYEHFDLSIYEAHRDARIKILCRSCVVKLETRHIEGLPLEDLPLYVNAQWITDQGYQAYMKRLETLSPAI